MPYVSEANKKRLRGLPIEWLVEYGMRRINEWEVKHAYQYFETNRERMTGAVIARLAMGVDQSIKQHEEETKPRKSTWRGVPLTLSLYSCFCLGFLPPY